MLKKRIVAVVMGVALLLAMTGVTGVVADQMGFSVTSPTFASPTDGGLGGR